MRYKLSVLTCCSFVAFCGAMHDAASARDTDLIQRIACLKDVANEASEGSVQAIEACCNEGLETVKALRRTMSLPRHDAFDDSSLQKKVFLSDSSPRVVAAFDAVLKEATVHLEMAYQLSKKLTQKSHLTPPEKRKLMLAEFVLFKHCVQSLFASIDEQGEFYGDEPRVATKLLKDCAADGYLLAGIEALESYAQATHDDALLCASCKGCPADLWCADCKAAIEKHSRVTASLQSYARETKKHGGVDDALWYLYSRIGALSLALDSYVSKDEETKWHGEKRARDYAEMRKLIVQGASSFNEIVPVVATPRSDQEEVASSSGGMLEGLVKGLGSYNPLKFLPAKAGSVALSTFLGIEEKNLPTFDKVSASVLETLSDGKKYLDLLLLESAVDVERFAANYKKPLREQLLSPACREHVKLCAFAWKTGSKAPVSRNLLVANAQPPVQQEEEVSSASERVQNGESSTRIGGRI